MKLYLNSSHVDKRYYRIGEMQSRIVQSKSYTCADNRVTDFDRSLFYQFSLIKNLLSHYIMTTWSTIVFIDLTKRYLMSNKYSYFIGRVLKLSKWPNGLFTNFINTVFNKIRSFKESYIHLKVHRIVYTGRHSVFRKSKHVFEKTLAFGLPGLAICIDSIRNKALFKELLLYKIPTIYISSKPRTLTSNNHYYLVCVPEWHIRKIICFISIQINKSMCMRQYLLCKKYTNRS